MIQNHSIPTVLVNQLKIGKSVFPAYRSDTGVGADSGPVKAQTYGRNLPGRLEFNSITVCHFCTQGRGGTIIDYHYRFSEEF
jgi:hypothetical protein